VCLQLLEHPTGLVGVSRPVEVPEPLLSVGRWHLGVGVSQLEQGGQPCGGFGIEFLLAHQQDPPGPVERIISATAVPGLFVLHPPPHGIEKRLAKAMRWKGSTTWEARGKATE
jgi:hypothetical protein